MAASLNPSVPTDRQPDRGRRLPLIAGCVALFIALRCLALTADPPRTINGFSARELYSEPPAKAHEARNYALFGAFQINAADNYQFWRVQSPFWVYPLAGYFALFGTDYPQLRTFSTLYAALGLAFLLWIAAEMMRPAVWLFVGLVLVLDPLYFHSARVGFLEPAVTTWLTLSMLALLRAERHPGWLCVAQLSFVMAFFTKQAAVYALPLIVAACFYRLLRAPRDRRWVVLGCTLLLGVASALYVSSSDYTRSVTHNVSHVLLGADWPDRYHLRGLGSLIKRLRDPERSAHFFASVPISGLIALAWSAGWAARLARRRKLPAYRELVLHGWFICALLAMEVTARSSLRFWTLVVPPAALIAGIGIEHALRALESRTRSKIVRPLPLTVPLLALLLWSARGHALFFRDPQYSVRDGARQLCQKIGERDATVVGFSSPGIVLGTPYKNFYLRGTFNANRTLIVQLGITHLLLRQHNDATRTIIDREFPKLLPRLRPKLEFQVRGEALKLFNVEGVAIHGRAPR